MVWKGVCKENVGGNEETEKDRVGRERSVMQIIDGSDLAVATHTAPLGRLHKVFFFFYYIEGPPFPPFPL